MNHRYGTRWPFQIKTLIIQKERYLGYYNIRNIGFGGAFLNNTPQQLSPNTMVDIILMPFQDNIPQCTLKAFIIHKGKTGIGLTFVDYDAETLGTMKKLLALAPPGNLYNLRCQTKTPLYQDQNINIKIAKAS